MGPLGVRRGAVGRYQTCLILHLHCVQHYSEMIQKWKTIKHDSSDVLAYKRLLRGGGGVDMAASCKRRIPTLTAVTTTYNLVKIY